MGWLRNLFGGGKKRRAAAVGVPPRAELETRPLADLHLYASKLGVKRYRLLRREALVTTLLKETGQSTARLVGSNGASAEHVPEPEPEPEMEQEPKRAARREPDPQPEPQPKPEEPEEPDEPAVERQGVIDVTRRGHGFLRCDGLTRSAGDAYVSRGQIRRLDLRSGDRLTAQVRPARRSERYPSVVQVDSVNGGSPDDKREAPFERLEQAGSARAFTGMGEAGNPTARTIDLLAPLAAGQSILVSAPSDVDAAAVLREVGRGLARDERVELSVVALGAGSAEWARWSEAETIDTVDDQQAPGARVGVAQLAVEQAKRRAEAGVDAVVLLDSATALADAHGEARRQRSDSDDSAAEPESEGAGAGSAGRLFGAARDTEQAGSLTIVAIGSDQGPLHDALAEQAAVEIVLDGDLGNPPIDPTRSRALDKEALPEQIQRRAALRSVIDSLGAREAWDFVAERLAESDSNDALLD